MKIGILKETKTPPDKRVPFSPEQCVIMQQKLPGLQIIVQESDIRAFKDEEYRSKGIEVVNNISGCDILMGVKEVKKELLLPNHTYLFFSHTIKKQPYNRELLQTIMSNKIHLIDYETLTFSNGFRILGFGRYAGVVGSYNSFLAYGKKSGKFELKSAVDCNDRAELELELLKIVLPSNYKIVITGTGRVGKGAKEILTKIGIKEVSDRVFVDEKFDEPVYTQLDVNQYYEHNDGRDFIMNDFFKDPIDYHSTFMKYASVGDMYIACHFWDMRAPFIFTKDDAASDKFKIAMVGDVSCDINGPVATTLRPSTIEEPLYGYDKKFGCEVSFMDARAIGVMAVDNLPCELPRDASIDFGNALIEKIIPQFFNNDKDQILERATITKDGVLTKHFDYLTDYIAD